MVCPIKLLETRVSEFLANSDFSSDNGLFFIALRSVLNIVFVAPCCPFDGQKQYYGHKKPRQFYQFGILITAEHHISYIVAVFEQFGQLRKLSRIKHLSATVLCYGI